MRHLLATAFFFAGCGVTNAATLECRSNFTVPAGAASSGYLVSVTDLQAQVTKLNTDVHGGKQDRPYEVLYQSHTSNKGALVASDIVVQEHQLNRLTLLVVDWQRGKMGIALRHVFPDEQGGEVGAFNDYACLRLD